MIEILTLPLGPVQTNTYIVADPAARQAVVIDPSWDGAQIAARIAECEWQVTAIWLTHAHFDHIGGIAGLVTALPNTPPVYLHPSDLDLYLSGGGGAHFGIHIQPGPQPEALRHHQLLSLGGLTFEVRHTPGHRPGHCIFYCQTESTLFSGDLLFYRSVGRTDLPGGDWDTLERSIRERVYVLPSETVVYPGHGEPTTVGDEKAHNPFVEV